MKIAIDIRTAGGEKTGKGWYTFHLVQELLKLDNENQYLLYSSSGIPGFDHFKNATMRIAEGKNLLWHYNVARDIQKENVDVFFAPSSFIIPAILPKSIKTIVTVHDLVAFLFPNNHNKKATLIEKIFLKRAVKKASRILTVSENTKHDLLKKFALSEDKIAVVPCSAGDEFMPLEKSTLTNFQQQTNLPKDFFLAVGTLEPRKNYVNLIKAFALLADKFPQYHLVIVGGKGWQYDTIYEEIRRNYLTKKVHLLGYISNSSLVKLYNSASALVFPSLYEGFGIPPLEAMKSGCPVIASNTSSIPEVVGDSAILVDPKSHLDIAGALIHFASHPNLAASLREKGLDQAGKFSWENSAKLLKMALESTKRERSAVLTNEVTERHSEVSTL